MMLALVVLSFSSDGPPTVDFCLRILEDCIDHILMQSCEDDFRNGN